ncbi:MAG TPA: hypothetical protein V6D22_23935 [Candidatus Obscuribacterales bacterium]
MAKKSKPSDGETVANQLQPGVNVSCKVVGAEAGGYSVVISDGDVPGFLPTDWRLQPGEHLIARFVSSENGRALLSAQMPTNPVMASWFTSIARLGLKRATDIMPTPAEEKAVSFKIDKMPFQQLITQLEGGRRTGVLTVACAQHNSRSAALLWRGSIAGCIYSNRKLPDPQPTEEGLQYMVTELKACKTSGRFYELPDVIALSFSAVFREYVTLETLDLAIVASRLAAAKDTACLAISLEKGATYLAFCYKGKFVGTFDVERQQYLQSAEQLQALMASNKVLRIGTSILPPDFFKDARRYTLWLSEFDKG